MGMVRGSTLSNALQSILLHPDSLILSICLSLSARTDRHTVNRSDSITVGHHRILSTTDLSQTAIQGLRSTLMPSDHSPWLLDRDLICTPVAIRTTMCRPLTLSGSSRTRERPRKGGRFPNDLMSGQCQCRRIIGLQIMLRR